ncbi:hypothetical protein AB4Z38_23630 [Arthrobacter sp. 2RAF6]|uniref:hypothetical protein n=1 Tax=Arthrobacter sp. 2RAF6 TaxID=3233002 RepID=UPI003F8FFFBF
MDVFSFDDLGWFEFAVPAVTEVRNDATAIGTLRASFTLRWYTLFEFRADWDGPWWEQMTWRHIKSWDVAKL